LRVIIDFSKSLERGRAIHLGGKSHWVIFKYEKMPLFCFHCGRTIHAQHDCPVRKSSRINSEGGDKQWGVWLRAELSRKEREGKGGNTGRWTGSPAEEEGDNGGRRGRGSSSSRDPSKNDGLLSPVLHQGPRLVQTSPAKVESSDARSSGIRGSGKGGQHTGGVPECEADVCMEHDHGNKTAEERGLHGIHDGGWVERGEVNPRNPRLSAELGMQRGEVQPSVTKSTHERGLHEGGDLDHCADRDRGSLPVRDRGLSGVLDTGRFANVTVDHISRGGSDRGVVEGNGTVGVGSTNLVGSGTVEVPNAGGSMEIEESLVQNDGLRGVKGWKRQARGKTSTSLSSNLGVSSQRKRKGMSASTKVEIKTRAKQARRTAALSLEETPSKLAAAVEQPRQ
jgi:hypothetical protein